jgi:hypothetical protein
LIRQADLKITEFMLLTLNDQDLNSPAWAQFRAWSEYSRRLQDEEWAPCVRLGTCVLLLLLLLLLLAQCQ